MKVYISSGRDSGARAARVRDLLEIAGFEVTLTPSSLRPDRDTTFALARHVDAILVLVSPGDSATPGLRSEWSALAELRWIVPPKRFVALVAHDVDIPAFLRNTPTIHSNHEEEENWHALLPRALRESEDLDTSPSQKIERSSRFAQIGHAAAAMLDAVDSADSKDSSEGYKSDAAAYGTTDVSSRDASSDVDVNVGKRRRDPEGSGSVNSAVIAGPSFMSMMTSMRDNLSRMFAKGRTPVASRLSPLVSYYWPDNFHHFIAPYRQDVLTSDFVKGVEHTRFSLSAIQGWILQMYPLVHTFPRYFAEPLLRAEDNESRLFLIDSIRTAKAEAEHWLWMGQGFGLSRDQMLDLAHGNRPVLRDVQSLTDWLWYINCKGSLAEAVAATTVAIEGVIRDICRTILPGFEAYRGVSGVDVSAKTFRWMRQHASKDDLRGEIAMDIVKRCATTERVQYHAILAAKRSLQLLNLAFDTSHRVSVKTEVANIHAIGDSEPETFRYNGSADSYRSRSDGIVNRPHFAVTSRRDSPVTAPGWVGQFQEFIDPYWNEILASDFVEGVANTHLSLSEMQGWMLQTYPFIQTFERFFAEAMIKAEDQDSLKFLKDSIIAAKAHAEHWVWMGEGFSLSWEQMLDGHEDRTLLRDVQSLTDWLWYINHKGTLAEAIAATSVAIEGVFADICRRILPGFEAYREVPGVDMSARTSRWIGQHALNGIERREVAMELVKRYATTTLVQRRVMLAAKRSLQLLNLAFDASYRAYSMADDAKIHVPRDDRVGERRLSTVSLDIPDIRSEYSRGKAIGDSA